MLLNTPTTTKDDCQYGKSIPDNQLSANTSQSTIRSRDDYRQLSSSPTTMKSNRKTINLRRKNRRATFDIHRQQQVNATIYLLLVDINAQCQQTWPTSTILTLPFKFEDSRRNFGGSFDGGWKTFGGSSITENSEKIR